MEKIAYLKNGQKVTVVKEVDGVFKVHPWMQYSHWDHNGDEVNYEEVSDQLMFVEEIFSKPPTEVIDAKIVALKEKCLAKQREVEEISMRLSAAKNELLNIQKQTTDLKKFIINRSDILKAKRITVFRKNEIQPYDLKNSGRLADFRLNVDMRILDGTIQTWHYKYYYDSWGASEILDEKIGFLLDKTDDEILAIARERAKTFTSEYQIRTCPVEYLSEEQMNKRAELEAAAREKAITDKKQALAKLAAELSKLEVE